jgi:hypothetical protein
MSTNANKIRFMKHYVTNGAIKARVDYNAHRMVSTGQECVTIYAKDYRDGRNLAEVFSDRQEEYENNTDYQTDYFEKGRIRILASSPLYAAALARCNA